VFGPTGFGVDKVIIPPPALVLAAAAVVAEVGLKEGETLIVLPVSEARDVAAAGVGSAALIWASDDEATAELVAETVTVVVEVVTSDVTTDAWILT
jgi:hypothetical protein